MGVPEGVPEGRCGFTLEVTDLPKVTSEGEIGYDRQTWHIDFDITCCWRQSWKESGRCLWHTQVEDKPVDELISSRAPRPERFDGVVLRKTELHDSISFKKCSFLGADLSESKLPDVNISEATLGVVDFTNANLVGANIANAKLFGSFLSDATLNGADLSNADMYSVDVSNSLLRKVNLSDTSMEGANISGADLRLAQVENTDFRAANLAATNLEGVDLYRADFRNADLRGIRMHNASIRDIRINRKTKFGNQCYYEKEAIENTDEEAADSLIKAVWTYRTYQRLLRENALPDKIPRYFVREKHARRKLALGEDDYLEWLKLSLARWTMLYGESPWRVVYTSLAVIILSAVFYLPLGGIHVGTEAPTHVLDLGIELPGFLQPIIDIGTPFLASLYFSVVTFTTLGYGDIQPASGAAQLLAGVESLLGAALIALLVAVLSRRVMR